MARPSNYNRNQVVVARGLRAASDRIRLMFGPLGRRILVESEAGNLVEAADVHTFARLYRPEDPRDRLGASYATEMVAKAHQQAGDGAATAVVLAQAMVEAATVALRAGAHPMALACGIEAGVARAIEALKALARDADNVKQIDAFAAMSARDSGIGRIIAEAVDQVGRDGALIVEEANTFGLELELTEGMKLDKGYISPYFVTDPERAECLLEEPYVLLVDFKLSHNADLLLLLDKVVATGKPLLIIAEDVEGEALATLVVNKIRDIFKSAAIKAPGFGDGRRAILEDIAILTGGQLISKNDLPGATVEMLGVLRNVIITKEETTLVDAAGNPDGISHRVNWIRAEIENTDSDYDREKLRQRLAKLAGGVAVIKVGAATESELGELKERCQRVIRAVTKAVAEGLLPGGCTSLCAIAHVVRETTEGNDRAAGVQVVAESLKAPYVQILANAGIPEYAPAGSEIDVLTGAPADLFSANIFDSLGVLQSALETAKETVIRFLRVA